jgi:catechol 2,3-dioxygenase-like lactoylglutathione lyase family enzyme
MDLNHLHLHVRNVDRSKRFYESYFGFRERVRHGNILFLRNASGFDLALVPDRTPLSFPEWFHFGFRLGGARAVRMLHDHMSSKGGQVQDIEEYPGYMTFRCADPDGYGIEVYWEVMNQNREVVMTLSHRAS